MVTLLVMWLLIICVIGAFFEKGWNRICLVLFAIAIAEIKFLPNNKWGMFILVVTLIVNLLMERYDKNQR